MLPQNKIERIVFGRIDFNPLTGAQIIERFAGKFAVTVKLAHGEIDIAIRRLIGQTVRLQLANQFEHLRHIISRARFMRRPQHAERIGVFMHEGDEAIGQLMDGFAVFCGAPDDFIVNVSNIADVSHFQTGGLEPAINQVKNHHHPGVAEVAIIINGHSAHIHAHLAGNNGHKRLFFTLERVENFQHGGSRIRGFETCDNALDWAQFLVESGIIYTTDCNMAMKALTRIQTGAKLRALLLGAVLMTALPALADNLPEVQRLIKQGQYPQALVKVDAYLASRPKDAQGRFIKGLILTEMNKPADAIAVFTKLTEDYPELPEPYNNLAVLYAQQKQYDKSRTALEMAIRTHPSYAIAYENLGDVYAKLASQAYDKALQIDSSNPTAQNKLALIRDLISTSGKPGVRPAPVKPEPVKVAAVSTTQTPTTTTLAATTTTTRAVVTSTTAPTVAVVSTTPAASAPATKAEPIKATPVAAETTPATAPASKAGDEEVAKALAGWAAAWSNKDVRGYLAHYSSDFKTPNGMPRKAWEAQRNDRIAGKGGKIQVSYDKPVITVDGNKATVKFRQHYKAAGLANSTGKVLIMVRSNGKWLIQDEQTR